MILFYTEKAKFPNLIFLLTREHFLYLLVFETEGDVDGERSLKIPFQWLNSRQELALYLYLFSMNILAASQKKQIVLRA